MFSTMSLVTSIKDYIEVVHKLIETDPNFVDFKVKFSKNLFFNFGGKHGSGH